jgi:outer membrane protein TolC
VQRARRALDAARAKFEAGNRNAIYKNLFDARRNLRARMAAAGHALPARHAA